MTEYILRLSITDTPLAVIQIAIHFYFHGDLHLVGVAVCVIPLETQKNLTVNPLYGGCFSDEHSSVASLLSLFPIRIPHLIPDVQIHTQSTQRQSLMVE